MRTGIETWTGCDGLRLPVVPFRAVRRNAGLFTDLRSPDGASMNGLYALGALIAIGLALYLCAALLKPEWFE